MFFIQMFRLILLLIFRHKQQIIQPKQINRRAGQKSILIRNSVVSLDWRIWLNWFDVVSIRTVLVQLIRHPCRRIRLHCYFFCFFFTRNYSIGRVVFFQVDSNFFRSVISVQIVFVLIFCNHSLFSFFRIVYLSYRILLLNFALLLVYRWILTIFLRNTFLHIPFFFFVLQRLLQIVRSFPALSRFGQLQPFPSVGHKTLFLQFFNNGGCGMSSQIILSLLIPYLLNHIHIIRLFIIICLFSPHIQTLPDLIRSKRRFFSVIINVMLRPVSRTLFFLHLVNISFVHLVLQCTVFLNKIQHIIAQVLVLPIESVQHVFVLLQLRYIHQIFSISPLFQVVPVPIFILRIHQNKKQQFTPHLHQKQHSLLQLATEKRQIWDSTYFQMPSLQLEVYIFYRICQQSFMRATNSRLNREEQVKVVIRLKPEQSQLRQNKCVYLSEQENQLVVQTDYKKEIFIFDHVAHQNASQLDIYRMIGEEAVQTSLEGYNCCIFAYGQTGAGKTHSIMGDINQIQQDYYCQSRGILPRLAQDIFNWLALHPDSTYKITCSYIEIYNEQIYDLLSHDKRQHQIRQDLRKGVFVQGINEKRVVSYKQAIELLLQGDKTRTTAYTSMNTESSRSHVIFTVLIESEIKEDQVIKVKKSKLNIVDLAGSERVKHTNVEGERLRQGCNINKSLHVLGNVINSLVESAKKKKHIPYRDSKLTYYLKDSLGGNSITKLLANVHCSKDYLGDTLSTLMFAKRAKSLKMKVEVNENLTQNFDSLRKQVRRLREELAEARYFKDVQKTQRNSFYQDFEQTLQKVTDNSDYQVTPKIQIIQVFQQNELHYKSLIEIYEERLKISNNQGAGRKNSLNMVNEWKNLQKRNIALTSLVNQFPAFTKIYKQNILLKQEKSRTYEEGSLTQDDKNISKKIAEETTFITIKQPDNNSLGYPQIEEIVKTYENIIDEIKRNFTNYIQNLEKSFSDLEHELRFKDKKIRQLVKYQDQPPDLEELRNQNEYLQLNILNLQNQIKQLRENEEKHKLERRESRKTPNRSSIKSDTSENQQDQQALTYALEHLTLIKKEAQVQAQVVEKQREQMLNLINQLQSQVSSLINQNQKLQLKYTRSGSQRKSRQKYKSHQFLQTETKMSTLDFCISGQTEYMATKSALSFQTQLKQVQTNHTKELMTLRLQIKMKQKEIVDLKQQIQRFEQSDRKLEQQFGKNIDSIIKQYRQLLRKQLMMQSPQTKSIKSINKYKQHDPISKYKEQETIINSNLDSRLSDRIVTKKLTDHRLTNIKEPPRMPKKQQNAQHYSNQKSKYFTSK